MEPDLSTNSDSQDEKLAEGHKIIKPSPRFNPNSAESGTPPLQSAQPQTTVSPVPAPTEVEITGNPMVTPALEYPSGSKKKRLFFIIGGIALGILLTGFIIGLNAYFTRDSRREAQLRTAIQQEMATIQFNAPFESQPVDSFRCSTGDGAFGEPRGFYCTGAIIKKVALPQDRNNAEQYIASKMAKAGWSGEGDRGTKTVGNIRLRVILSAKARESMEDIGGSARAQAIQKEEINEINNILDRNPGTNSVTFVLFSATYVDPENSLFF